ncbi:MAG: hypothetical protein ACLP7W_09995 [Solirubrobacteraceae bacterium]
MGRFTLSPRGRSREDLLQSVDRPGERTREHGGRPGRSCLAQVADGRSLTDNHVGAPGGAA